MEMRPDIQEAVRKVLDEAPDEPNFFDLSDSERLLVMIAMGFELGKQVRHVPTDAERN